MWSGQLQIIIISNLIWDGDLELGEGVHGGEVGLGVRGLSRAGVLHARGVHLQPVALQCAIWR